MLVVIDRISFVGSEKVRKKKTNPRSRHMKFPSKKWKKFLITVFLSLFLTNNKKRFLRGFHQDLALVVAFLWQQKSINRKHMRSSQMPG